MRVSKKVAIEVSDAIGINGKSPYFTKKVKELFSGCAKKEKKQIAQTLIRIAKSDKPNTQDIEQLERILQRTRPNTAQYDVHSTVQRMQTTKRMFTSIREIPKAIDEISTKTVKDITSNILSPESISKISREALKEGYISSAKIALKQIFSPITYLASKLIVPKGEHKALAQLVKLPKEQFGKKYYEYLIKSLGLEGRAPSTYTVTNKSARTSLFTKVKCEGGFNNITNTMEFTREFPTMSRSAQASLLRHELLHFQQHEMEIQAVGIDGYIQTMKNRYLKKLASENPTKNQTELLEMVEADFKEADIDGIVRKAFATSKLMPRLQKGTKEYTQAIKYTKATENYSPPKMIGGLFVDFDSDYLKNALEREAYKKGFWAKMKVQLMELLNIAEA